MRIFIFCFYSFGIHWMPLYFLMIMFPNRKYVVDAICDSDDCWLNAFNSMICVWHVKWTNKCFFVCAFFSFFQLLLKEYVFLLFSFLACSIKTRWIWNEKLVQFESDLFCAIPLSYSNIFDYYQHVVLLWKSGIRMTDCSHFKIAWTYVQHHFTSSIFDSLITNCNEEPIRNCIFRKFIAFY